MAKVEKKQEVYAVEVLVDSLTDGNKIYPKGTIVFDPSDALLECAEDVHASPRKARKLSRSEALKAAKAVDKGDLEEGAPPEAPEEDEDLEA